MKRYGPFLLSMTMRCPLDRLAARDVVGSA